MEVVLKLRKSNKHAAFPTCNSFLQVPFWFWLIDGASGEKSTYWCHGVHLPCFDFWPCFALSFCTHGGRSQHSGAECCRHTGALLNFDGTFCLGRSAHTMQTYKGLFFFKSTFFAEGRPDGVRKYGKMRPKYGNIRPVWTRPDPKDFFWKSVPFFTRPSVHQSKLFQQCVGTKRSRPPMCSNPCIFCRSVAMCTYLPRQLTLRSKQTFCIATGTVDPKLFKQAVLVMRLGLTAV